MSETVFVNSIEKLAKYLNDNGVLEVAYRDGNKRFKQFLNIAIDGIQEDQRELTERAIQHICEMTRDNQLSIERLINNSQLLSGLGYANLLLNAVNLGATCTGFIIMYREMKQLSAELNQHIMQLDETVRKGFDIEHQFKLDQVLAEHNDMLDGIKRRQPYTEREMRRLVDDEHRMILLLINTLKADVSNDQGSLIVSLFSLMGMFTASLCNFDELYYFNNPQTHGHENPWHMSHENWMAVYDDMTSEWFVKKLQDYCVLERGMRTWEADVMYFGMLDQVVDAKEQVEDNQALIVAFGTRGALRRFRELTKRDVVNAIRGAYQEAGAEVDDTEAKAICEETLQMAALV